MNFIEWVSYDSPHVIRLSPEVTVAMRRLLNVHRALIFELSGVMTGHSNNSHVMHVELLKLVLTCIGDGY